jgi:UDPglucose 6-dehydrogenase
MKKICVIGCGYVGLVTGTCLAEIGNRVICVDNDGEKISCLKKFIIPIYEPNLKEMIKKNVNLKRISFTTSIKEGVEKSEIIFIAVGTPPKEDGSADLSSIEKVAHEIARHMREYKVIVEKSTVPVETGEWVETTVRRNNLSNCEFDVVSNPEFLREGSAINDFLHPDRIIIGVKSKKAEKIMCELYAPMKTPILVTDTKSAELIKHASNSFLATKISFINAVANFCELVGANIKEVAQGIGLDKRIGKDFLNAGCGFGGFCLPKDLEAFYWISNKLGYNFDLLMAVKKINEEQKKNILKKIEETIWIINGKTIGVLGLSFKPNTDDIRFSPAIDIIKMLQEQGAKIKVYDPQAMEKAKKVLKDIKFCLNPYEVAKNSECLVILTEWDEFKKLDIKRLSKLLKHPIIIDGRNIYEPEKMRELGFVYKGVGR